METATAGTARQTGFDYAGFWRRFVAVVIDWFIVGLALWSIFLATAVAFPKLDNMITLNSPLGLFTVNRTLETIPGTPTSEDGLTTTVDEAIVEQTVLNRWTYLFRRTETVQDWMTPDGPQTKTKTVSRRIDPETRQEIRSWSVTDFTLIALMIYWIVLEASPLQASLGKMALGLRVVGSKGERLSLMRAAGRNLLKMLSVLTVIGFMLAGWTKRKQALHDLTTRSLVVMPSD